MRSLGWALNQKDWCPLYIKYRGGKIFFLLPILGSSPRVQQIILTKNYQEKREHVQGTYMGTPSDE